MPSIEIFYEGSRTLHSGMVGRDEVRVIQQGDVRSLLFGYGAAHMHCEIDVTDLRKHLSCYSLSAMYSLMFNMSPESILVVGLGGGVVPREMGFHLPDADIDVLELHPEMVAVARDFFFFRESDRMKVRIGDAFSTVQGLPDTYDLYDLLFLDAFGTSHVPPQLMSVEFFSFVKTVCRQDAVVAVNMLPSHISFPAHMRALMGAFGDDVYSMPCYPQSQNSILFFSLGGREPSRPMLLPERYYPRDISPREYLPSKAVFEAEPFSIRKRNGV